MPKSLHEIEIRKREERIATLERELQEERARGAVVREAGEDLVAAYRVACRLEDCDVRAGLDVHGHPLDPKFLRAASVLSDPSPAAQALLRLVEAAMNIYVPTTGDDGEEIAANVQFVRAQGDWGEYAR